MAQLFKVELIRLSWLQKKQVKDTLFYPASDPNQSFIPGRVWPRYPTSLSSTLLPIFCTSSNTQPELKARSRRSARSTMRDTQLCKELQLFLSSQGLPLDKVPSTKELSKCGREDLAKIVRRRGYKAVQALLEDCESKQGIVQEDKGVHRLQDSTMEASTAVSNPNSLREEHLPNTLDDSGQSLESSLGSISGASQETIKVEATPHTPEATTSLNGSPIAKQGEEELRRRAAEFVRTGRLDQLPDSDKEEEEDDNELYEDSSDEEENSNIQIGKSNAQGIAVEKAALLRAKLLPFLKGKAPGELSNQVESILSSSQGLKVLEELNQVSPRIQRDSTSEELQEIKSALVNKERELREVSRDLEETKAQLALIQAKAIAEVAQANQLALEKDLRLKTADLALANLKQVQVEYWGEGERVELAGSFNGWRYFILMEADPTSEIIKPDGSRGPMMWGTELWLYPGVYEIKFIIDGVWQIDQRREIVTRNSHHNNLLRVDP